MSTKESDSPSKPEFVSSLVGLEFLVQAFRSSVVGSVAKPCRRNLHRSDRLIFLTHAPRIQLIASIVIRARSMTTEIIGVQLFEREIGAKLLNLI